MGRPPIKRQPQTPEKLPAKPNREAILTAQESVDRQLAIKDSADTAAGGPPPRNRDGDTDTSHLPDAHDAMSGGGMLTVGENGSIEPNKTAQERHDQRLDWFYSECSRQAPNRFLMARDEAMYDGEQYTVDDANTLNDRGQKPVVYNEIGPTIDFLIGTERRSRVDFYVVAEDDDEQSGDDAIAKTKVLKYLDDVNMAPFERSYASAECFKGGLGVLEIGRRGDKKDVPVFVGSESWRNFIFDSRAKMDQSDARFNFRIKEVDLDIAIMLFPKFKAELTAASTQGDDISAFKGMHGIMGALKGLSSFEPDTIDTNDKWGGVTKPFDFFNSRERVTLIECWSREPIRNPDFQTGLGDPISYKIRVSIMIESVTLLESWSPYKHDRFPFVLLWAYRNKRTGMPYGPARRLYGPQVSLNHRMARGLFEASFNQLEIEADAVDKEAMTLEELHEEGNDPNGIMIWARGALSGNKVRWRNNPGAGREQIQYAEGDRMALRAMSGVNEENRGLNSSATSRVAMDAKAERGSVGTAELFDNLLMARQIEGELTLACTEQFFIQPATIRVAGESGPGQTSRLKVNQPSHYDENGQPVYLNDLSARRAHFVVGEQAWKQSYAESAFQQLMEMLTQLASAAPQVVINLLDIVFDMHPNLPRKKQVIDRIRAINGQADPDGKMTPEQQQAAQQKAQVAQQQFELQMAQLKADVVAAQAKGQKLSVDAMLQRITALYEAAQAAQVLGMAPHLAPIVDELLASAGYIDQSGSPHTLPVNLGSDGQQPGIQPGQPAPGGKVPPLQQADGHLQGIETARPQDDIAQQGAPSP